jgi:hypothetical protein
MTMTDRHETDGEAALDALFGAARKAHPEPSAALLARIAADAEAVAADRARQAVARPARGGALRGWLSALGGWPAVAGLATATVAGVWIGYAQPDLGSVMLIGTADEGAYDIGGLLPGYVADDDWSG